MISRSFGSSQKMPAVAWRMRVRNKPGLHSFEEEGPDFVVGGDGYGEVRGVQLDNFIDVLPGVCTRNRPLTAFQVYIHPVGIVPSPAHGHQNGKSVSGRRKKPHADTKLGKSVSELRK